MLGLTERCHLRLELGDALTENEIAPLENACNRLGDIRIDGIELRTKIDERDLPIVNSTRHIAPPLPLHCCL